MKYFDQKEFICSILMTDHHDAIYYIASFFKSCLHLNKIKICYHLQLSLGNYLCIIFQYYEFNLSHDQMIFFIFCLINSLQIPMVHNKRDARNLIHINYFHIPGHSRGLVIFLPK